MAIRQNILVCLLLVSILSACCWGGNMLPRVSFGVPLTVLPAKNIFQVNDTIKIRLKIPTQLYDSLSKNIVEYRNQDIFLHTVEANTTNIFLSKNFDLVVNKGTKQEYVNVVSRQGVLLTTTNDYYELSMDCIAKEKGKFGLYFNIEIPKFYKDDCNGVSYDAITLDNDSIKVLNVDFLKRNPTFSSPYLYNTYSGLGGHGILLMVEVQ